jgi:glycosyltransferase involved in cell wall biosynthesis
MLLDNHYGPDPRVAFEAELLSDAGISTSILAWDRRSASDVEDRDLSSLARPKVTRVRVPAPSGGGWRSLKAVVRFGRCVWRAHAPAFKGASLIIVHDVYLLPLGWALGRRLRIPFLYDAHEEYGRMEADRYPAWFRRVVTSIESRLARRAVAVAVPGASRIPRWEGVHSRAPIVLPNLVQRDRPSPSAEPVEWDLLYIGTVGQKRRLDLLVELARLRPELRVGIAGRGRSVGEVARAAENLPNLTFLGWRSDADTLLARARAIYYGLDPDDPYSAVACPNTLYQALRHRKPLIFFCAGEMAQLAAEFKIGFRCSPSVQALSSAIDEVAATSAWEFDAAWEAVWERADTQEFVEVVESVLRPR